MDLFSVQARALWQVRGCRSPAPAPVLRSPPEQPLMAATVTQHREPVARLTRGQTGLRFARGEQAAAPAPGPRSSFAVAQGLCAQSGGTGRALPGPRGIAGECGTLLPGETCRAELCALGQISDHYLLLGKQHVCFRDIRNLLWKPLFPCFLSVKRGRKKNKSCSSIPPAPRYSTDGPASALDSRERAGDGRWERSSHKNSPGNPLPTAALQNTRTHRGAGVKPSATLRRFRASSPKHFQKHLHEMQNKTQSQTPQARGGESAEPVPTSRPSPLTGSSVNSRGRSPLKVAAAPRQPGC